MLFACTKLNSSCIRLVRARPRDSGFGGLVLCHVRRRSSDNVIEPVPCLLLYKSFSCLFFSRACQPCSFHDEAVIP